MAIQIQSLYPSSRKPSSSAALRSSSWFVSCGSIKCAAFLLGYPHFGHVTALGEISLLQLSHLIVFMESPFYAHPTAENNRKRKQVGSITHVSERRYVRRCIILLRTSQEPQQLGHALPLGIPWWRPTVSDAPS